MELEQKGSCLCVKCDLKIPHYKGQPCREQNCKVCGSPLMREGSYHHQLYLKKIGDKSYENGNSDKE